MYLQTLNGYWQLRQAGTQDWLPAQVPGSVHTDLMAAQKLPDPFYGTNEEQVQWVAGKSWEYRRFFYPLPAVFRQEKIWLVCTGLDTLAEVRLNGRILGQTDNMFRTWKWEIKNLLQEGENRLEILFRSPTGYAKARQRVKRLPDLAMGIHGGPHLRKTPSHFGWDWGPRLPCMGIWQEIRLEGHNQGRLGEIRFDQEHTPNQVTLTARVQCELWGPPELHHTVRLRITGPDRRVWVLDAPARPQSVMTVTLPNPLLWWPAGYGPQNLYQVEVDLRGDDESVLDARTFSIGLRTVELGREDDAFTFVVNGMPVFCKGSNWIPADSFPARITAEQVEGLIAAAVQANHNMLRVWGGGYYESDTFYDLCDRYGLLVWQDFQFACGVYPLDDPAYLDNVRCEVTENVQRLRHHASLVLWCGNNEIEWLGQKIGWWRQSPQAQAYERFFFHDLPGILAAEDPQRPYWPSSPSSNEAFKIPNSDQKGDAHLWEVYHAFRPPRYYRQQNPRFVSEFGFQALPPLATIQTFAPPQAHKLNSRALAMHQRALAGNPKLLWYLAQRFRLPGTFEGLVYLSQVFQAEAVRTGVEHWRRHPERTSGTLYWQLNDCWPVISWASIDYYGRWKALHYAARRFYAPVLLSVEDQTERGKRKMAVWVTNDSCEPWQGKVHWTLETLTGEVLEGGDQPVESAGQSSQCVLQKDFARHNGAVDWRQVIFTAELCQGSERDGMQVATFIPEKDMRSLPAELQTEVLSEEDGTLQIRVSTRNLARFVELWLEGGDTVFSNNFFDLPAGRSEVVTCPMPAGWTTEQAAQALRSRSLAEIGPCASRVASHWQGDLALLQCLSGMLWHGLIKPVFQR